MFENFRIGLSSFFSEARDFIAEGWSFLALVYLLGLIGLTFYSVQTGLTLTPFWMYSPILPLVVMIYVSFLYGTYEKWHKGRTYRNGAILLTLVVIWPILVWHAIQDFGFSGKAAEVILKTRFWSLACLPAVACWDLALRFTRRILKTNAIPSA